MREKSSSCGFTLLEILIAIAIVGVLAVLITANYGRIAQSVAKARCMSNMRAIHVGLESYLQEHRIWPQIPEDQDPFDPRVEDLWIRTLNPYIDRDDIWMCPVLKAAGLEGPHGNVLRMHYMPTRFDANPASPRRYSTQPWLVEMADAHGDGALIAFPDGRIQSMGEVLRSLPPSPAQ